MQVSPTPSNSNSTYISEYPECTRRILAWRARAYQWYARACACAPRARAAADVLIGVSPRASASPPCLSERRLAYRAASLRWHPDKFVQSFGAQLVPSEREAVLKRVTEVSQAINAIFQAQGRSVDS